MNNIHELRVRAGIKQTTLAKETGSSQSSVSDWEKGKTNFPIDIAIMLARFFRVSVGCVVGEEPVPANYPNHIPSPSKVGDLLPAFIGDKQVRKVEVFSDEQIAAIRRIVSEAVSEIQEDTSSLNESSQSKNA